SVLTNRVALTKAITVQSVNGPAVTSIEGFQTPGSINGAVSVRCAWLTNRATLSGFTLTNGATLSTTPDNNGGGAFCWSTNATLTNCLIFGNAAGGSGGGVHQGTLWRCIISGNSARNGGGANQANLNQCE